MTQCQCGSNGALGMDCVCRASSSVARACQQERIATAILGHLLAADHFTTGRWCNESIEKAVEAACHAARKLAERFP